MLSVRGRGKRGTNQLMDLVQEADIVTLFLNRMVFHARFVSCLLPKNLRVSRLIGIYLLFVFTCISASLLQQKEIVLSYIIPVFWEIFAETSISSSIIERSAKRYSVVEISLIKDGEE